MNARSVQPSPFSTQITMLLQAAMALFLVTTAVGILNGLDLVEFDRRTLLTHVHAGALGWITLGVFAATLWLFARGDGLGGWHASFPRWLAPAAIGSTALYSLVFYTSFGIERPVTGTLMLLAILGFLVWTTARSRQIRLNVPQLALLAAITNLAIGAVVGVLLGLQLAGRLTFLPEGTFIAHAGAMVVGYLILAGMAITEWRLVPELTAARDDRWGVAQVAFPFLGGLTLIIGALVDFFPLIVLNVPLEILGVLVFFWRIGRHILRVPWLEGSDQRLFGISALYIAVNIGILAYLIVNYAENLEGIPPWLFFALDHALFIGVMSNGLFGLLYVASIARREFWPWVEHVLFWGMNVGLVGFVVGLIMQSPELKRAFTPVMGVSILVAMLTYAIRLQSRPRESA